MDIDEIRRSVNQAVSNQVELQDAHFYDEIVRINAQLRSDRAVADLLRCDCIPIMQPRGEHLDSVATKVIADRISRGVLPPIHDNSKKPKPPLNRSGSGITTATASSKQLSTSSKKTASRSASNKKRPSSSSASSDADALLKEAYFWEGEVALAILPADPLYEAAIIYIRLKMYDRTFSLFGRALASRVDGAGVVDEYLLPDTVTHQRKLARLGKQQLEAYVSNRNYLRSLYIIELEQYQHRREHDIHCEMFRLHLMLGDLDKAHKSLLAAFDIVDKIVPEVMEMQSPPLEQFVQLDKKSTPCEWRGRDDDDMLRSGGGATNFSAAHGVRQLSIQKYRKEPRRTVGDQSRVRMYTLLFMHEVLKALLPYQESKLSVNEQLLRLSAGPLCEAHIVVLHELLEAVASEAHRAEFAYHLGLRYAQKNDYTSSHKYFELSRTLGDPRKDDTVQEVLGQRVSRTTDAERIAGSFDQFTAKKSVRSFSYGEDYDRARHEERKDYTEFPGRHEGTTVIVYRTPGCGWEASVAERGMMRDKGSQADASGAAPHPLIASRRKKIVQRPFDVQELIKSHQF